MKKPWSGRFKAKTSRTVDAFTESVSFDRRLWKHDIEGSIAHARMLGKQGIISAREAREIVRALGEIAASISSGTFRFREELEDIHMNIEAALTEKTGGTGKKLHTARSRNDQVSLDLRLYAKEAAGHVLGALRSFQRSLVTAAEKHMGIIMPGYTHLQRAQPVLLSHHLMAYVEMLERDRERFRDAKKRTDVMPLGSCALSGTSLPVDRNFVARALGFRKISANSMDAVSDRDFVIEFLSCASITMMHLSRFAEELVLWSSEEFRFIEISDEYTTGSSIMPQKKNPDVAELVRGRTGRVYGSLVTLLTIMKSLPLTYNRDMQEDKVPFFDAVDTLLACLGILSEMMPAVRFNGGRMEDTSGEGFSTATDIAEYLVRKGIPFRESHEITGRLVGYCIGRSKALHELTLPELRSFSSRFSRDVFSVLKPAAAVRSRKTYGSTAPSEVKRQIRKYKKLLA